MLAEEQGQLRTAAQVDNGGQRTQRDHQTLAFPGKTKLDFPQMVLFTYEMQHFEIKNLIFFQTFKLKCPILCDYRCLPAPKS